MPHVTATCKSSFYHLRNIYTIRRFLTPGTTESICHSFVASRINYCNSILYGLAKCVLKSSNMFKTLLQGSSAYLRNLIMLLLSLSICIGFPVNREFIPKFSSSPIKLWMERLLNTYPISFHFKVTAEISAHQITISSAKHLTTWKPMVPVLSPVRLRYYGTRYRMTSITPALLILLTKT